MAEPTIQLGGGNWAGKTDNLLGYYKEGERFYKQDFTFSRSTTGTYTDKDGYIQTSAINMPRVDYLNNSNGSLILEPQRTNLIANSNDFTTNWSNLISGSGVNPVVTSNQGTSPDGTLNADRVVFDLNGGITSSDYSLLDYNLSGFSNLHTLDTSIYLKSSDGNNYQVAIYNRGSSIEIITVTNQWQRFSANGTRSNTTNNFRIGLFGDNTSNNASLLLFGAQAELGSYSTTLINTSGSSVTRNQDTCSITNVADRIGQTEGTLFYDGYYGFEPAEVYLFLQENLGNGVSDSIYIQKFGSNSIAVQVFDGNNLQIQLPGGSYVFGQRIKIAFAYKQNDFAFYINNVQIGVSTSGLIPTLNSVQIGTYPALANTNNYIASNGTNEVKLYNTRLSNSELATLTTL